MIFIINVIGISEYLSVISRNFNIKKAMRYIRITTAMTVVTIFANREDKKTFITGVVEIITQAFIIKRGKVSGMNRCGCFY